MRKRFSNSAVSIILTAILLFSFCACAQDDSPGTEEINTDGYQTFDVMSLNIRLDTFFDFGEKDWSDVRAANVIEYLKNSGADLICLQEVCGTQYDDLAAALDGIYSIIYYQRESGRNPEGLAILYSDDFVLEESSRFWLSSTPDKESKDWGAANKRISVNAVLTHKESGLKINLFTVHLDHISELSRENGLALILEKAAGYDCPAILAGDFNTTEESDCYKVISSRMQDCRKAAAISDGGLTYQNFGIRKDSDDSLPIDFCFVDNSFKVFKFEIKDELAPDGTYYSDHYAIRSFIGLPCGEKAER